MELITSKQHCSIAFGLSAGVLAVAVVSAAQGDVRREIQAIYDRASAAALAARTIADIDAIHNWLDTPDCVYTDAGQPPRSWALQRTYAVGDLRTPLKSFSNQIQNFEVEGPKAVVTTIVKGVARVTDNGGRFGPKRVDHDVETTATVRDVWVRTSDGWRRQAHTKIGANRITAIDGKRLSP